VNEGYSVKKDDSSRDELVNNLGNELEQVKKTHAGIKI
jgi:hypothetical protein